MPLARSVLKNRCGIADAGKGQHALAAQRGHRRLIRLQMRAQHRLALRGDRGRHRAGGGAVADNDQRIGARELRLQRRAQADRRETPARCRGRGRRRSRSARRPWRSPDSGSRRPSGSRSRLAHAPARRPRRARAPPPPAAWPASISGSSPTSAAACRAGIDPDRPAQFSAIAAAEHDRRLAELAQQLRQRQHGRRLAGAADMIVADAEHGNAGMQSLALQAPRRDRAIERAERPQQMRVPAKPGRARRPAHALAAPISSRNCSR